MGEYNFRTSIGYPYHKSDIHWNTQIIMIYPLYAMLSGCLAGLLGIGGGLILGPLLLELGLHPLVNKTLKKRYQQQLQTSWCYLLLHQLVYSLLYL